MCPRVGPILFAIGAVVAGVAWNRSVSGSWGGRPRVWSHWLKLVVGFDRVDGQLSGVRITVRRDDPSVLEIPVISHQYEQPYRWGAGVGSPWCSEWERSPLSQEFSYNFHSGARGHQGRVEGRSETCRFL